MTLECPYGAAQKRKLIHPTHQGGPPAEVQESGKPLLPTLTRLRRFAGSNWPGAVEKGLFGQKSALQDGLDPTRCTGDSGQRLGRQVQFHTLQEQPHIRLRLGRPLQEDHTPIARGDLHIHPLDTSQLL